MALDPTAEFKEDKTWPEIIPRQDRVDGKRCRVKEVVQDIFNRLIFSSSFHVSGAVAWTVADGASVQQMDEMQERQLEEVVSRWPVLSQNASFCRLARNHTCNFPASVRREN